MSSYFYRYEGLLWIWLNYYGEKQGVGGKFLVTVMFINFEAVLTFRTLTTILSRTAGNLKPHSG